MNEAFILKLFEKFEKGTSVFLHIKDNDTELTLKKEAAFPKKEAPAASQPIVYAAPPLLDGHYSEGIASSGAAIRDSQYETAQKAADTPQANQIQHSETPADSNCVHIKSPIVGTFYRSPSPDSPPYVEKGTRVKKGQPLCILEAMKMMNTLESEFDGVIEDILIANGDLVEFEQNLFTIRVDA